MFGSKIDLYLSLFNSNFWPNDGAHPLVLHRMVTWLPIIKPTKRPIPTNRIVTSHSFNSFFCSAMPITKPRKRLKLISQKSNPMLPTTPSLSKPNKQFTKDGFENPLLSKPNPFNAIKNQSSTMVVGMCLCLCV